MERLRERFEAFWEAQAAAVYRFRSGRAARLDLARVDDEFGEITGGEALEEIHKAEQEATGDTRDAWRRLGVGVGKVVYAAKGRALAVELGAREVADALSVDGEEGTLFAWESRLALEDDPDRRRRIEAAVDERLAEQNPLREELRACCGEALDRVGLASRRSFAEAARPGVDFDAWRTAATRLLESTEAIYRDGVRGALLEVGAVPERARRGDLERWLRLDGYADLFRADRLRSRFAQTVEGMGIRLDDVPGVSVDETERPGKNPRACCVAERLPGAIHVILLPRGGIDDYEAFFHQCGHALHFAYTSSTLPIERRVVLDAGTAELFAFLLQYRIHDPDWIADDPTAPRAGSFAQAVRLRKLAFVRRYAAKVRYELELESLPNTADPRPLAELYAAELSEATGTRYSEARYLYETDPWLYSVDSLRAWCLESQLVEHLRTRFGRRFWRERRAGDLLKELWNTGATYTAEELAAALGIGPISVDLLLEQLS